MAHRHRMVEIRYLICIRTSNRHRLDNHCESSHKNGGSFHIYVNVNVIIWTSWSSIDFHYLSYSPWIIYVYIIMINILEHVSLPGHLKIWWFPYRYTMLYMLVHQRVHVMNINELSYFKPPWPGQRRCPQGRGDLLITVTPPCARWFACGQEATVKLGDGDIDSRVCVYIQEMLLN